MNAATPGPAAHPLGVTWLVVLLSLALVAPATAASGAHGSRRTGFTLTVLHNNDGESDLLADPADPDPGAGTISRFGHQVKELRAQALRAGQHTGTKAGVVTVSAGDNFLASPEWQASLDKGVPYYDAIALDSLDYDAFTIGNHEFDFGPDVLANFINSFRAATTCSCRPTSTSRVNRCSRTWSRRAASGPASWSGNAANASAS